MLVLDYINIIANRCSIAKEAIMTNLNKKRKQNLKIYFCLKTKNNNKKRRRKIIILY
jgi:hypothetical protein